jgi:site-specific recombinase XerD
MEICWKHYPQVETSTQAATWLTIQSNLGLARTTIDAYGRALQEYLRFCMHCHIDPERATREHIASYVNDLTTRGD